MRIFLPILLVCANAAQADIVFVDTTSDASLTDCTAAPGDCSLRGALALANGVTVAHEGHFNIPTRSDAGCVAATGVCTIRPASPLPSINPNLSGLVVIDGYTQPDAAVNTLTPDQGGTNAQLKIVVSGDACNGNCPFGLRFLRSGTVRGLVINGFRTFSGGFAVTPGFDSGGVVEGCFLGTDVTGMIGVPNGGGVMLDGNVFGGLTSSNARIGGSEPAQRNLISGNLGSPGGGGEGIVLLGINHSVLGNLIGTNAAGTAAIPNEVGIFLKAGSNFAYFVGNGSAAGRNVISGNQLAGILLRSGSGEPPSVNGTRIIGNFIGTDVMGTLPMGNGGFGISIGVTSNSAQQPPVGGTAVGEGNVIAFNGSEGVSAGFRNGNISGNRMFANARLGISVRSGGRTPNDPGDTDPVENRGQNYPDISAFALAGGNVNLSYRVDSATTSSAYPLRVEFFKADGDEGRDFLGTNNYTAAEAQTVKAISLPVPAGVTITVNDVVVGTATDADGETSEFSFHPAALNIIDDRPDPSPSGTPYEVVVEVAALSGPFVPNGIVQVSDGVGGSCEAALAPTSTALTAAGTCLLTSGGAPGTLTLTARYDTFRHAFGSETGTSLSATTSHTLSPPPPEQVTFANCVHSALEGAGAASVRVNRQGGGDASVAFEHIAGSATAGVDYTAPTAGVLSWIGSDMTPRFINVPLLDDATREALPETFRLRLLDPLGTSITPIGLLEVRIYDDEEGRMFFDGFEGLGCPQ